MKAYTVKYATTKGIEQVEGEVCESTPDMFRCTQHYGYYHKGEWTTDLEEAKRVATEKVQKKIKSLEKQIENLKKLDFSKSLTGK